MVQTTESYIREMKDEQIGEDGEGDGGAMKNGKSKSQTNLSKKKKIQRFINFMPFQLGKISEYSATGRTHQMSKFVQTFFE